MNKKYISSLLGALIVLLNVTGYAEVLKEGSSVKTATAANVQAAPQFVVTPIKGPNLDKEYAFGMTAPFCGVVNNTLILAGGYNYPGNVLGNNENKRYYKDIYGAVLQPNKKKLSWKKLTELPEALASGTAVATKEAMYFIGGTNAKGDKAACYELKLDNGIWKCEAISWLPVVISNHGAAVIDGYIYVLGGLQNGKASSDMYRMNLNGDRRKWEKLPSIPEDRRIQPVVIAQKDASGKTMLYAWAGFDGWGKEAGLICGGYKYNPETRKWQGLGAPLKNEKRVYLGGGKAVAMNDDKIIVVGGFNYEVFLKSLIKLEDDYHKHEAEWYRHNQEIYCFDTKTNKWSSMGAVQSLGTVHAGLAADGNFVYNVAGELKPGTNTNVISRLKF